MKLRFILPYRTRWGEQIKAALRVSGLGRAGVERLFPLRTSDGEIWSAELDVDLPAGAELIYYYTVHENGRLKRKEWQAVPRKVVVGTYPAQYYELRDSWRDAPILAPYFSTAYTNRLPAHDYEQQPDALFNHTLVLRAFAPQLQRGDGLFVCGEEEALGAWNPEKAVPMVKTSMHEWSLSLDAQQLKNGSAFKFILRDADQKIVWEEGPDRSLPSLPEESVPAVVFADFWPVFALPLWRIAGTVLPVFSIRTEGSFGSGDFGDLKRLADWAARTGQKALQLLPVNDTTLTGTWMDSYPYNAASVYALHPMYIDIRQLPELKDKQQVKNFETERRRLNAMEQVDYESVNEAKHVYLHLSFEQDGAEVLDSQEFKQFFKRNQFWLVPYAAFCVLRDRFGTADFTRWPEFRIYDPRQVAALCAPSSPSYRAVAYYYYVQFVLHKQLLDAAQYARNKGVLLKGDIPIGVSRYSADAWSEPALFHLNAQAGAPPDPFSATGQNWGFPTYNWEEMAKYGYSWWKRRFEKMSEYFEAYRVDHILGFFRIWEIPLHSVQGLLGQFSPALPMNTAEIASYGLAWKERYLVPSFSKELVSRLFNDQTDYVTEQYLQERDGVYTLKPEYDTQRKVEAATQNDPNIQSLREGLYTLINQVLFVADRNDPSVYHPRIGVLSEPVFQALSLQEQEAFTRLYNHYFYERHNAFWAEQALKKLPALTQSSRLLPCAEDLGMIPACVPGVLDQLKMLTLEIQRMPKQPGMDFADPASYPWRSVCCMGTHDMSTFRGWWKEDKTLTQRFYNEVLGLSGEAPAEASAEVCEQVLRQHINSPSLMCMLSWQDWTSIDASLRSPDPEAERINIPANPRHYWRYRMHLTVEELMKNEAFNTRLRRLIEEGGR